MRSNFPTTARGPAVVVGNMTRHLQPSLSPPAGGRNREVEKVVHLKGSTDAMVDTILRSMANRRGRRTAG
ncbi:MAG TPA: hypothetical protein VGN72_14560 [Tepidisphaeraceae bacterium]|nr:hypothetical protein [Tepidisphaeraceae bacterium]